MVSLFRCSLVTLILLGSFAIAEVFVQTKTDALTVQCKEGAKSTDADAKVRLGASADMATGTAVSQYYHTDPNGYDPYLEIPYYFVVPGLDCASHTSSVISGGGWRRGYLKIVVERVPIYGNYLELVGWSYSLKKVPYKCYQNCTHLDEEGNYSIMNNSFDLIFDL